MHKSSMTYQWRNGLRNAWLWATAHKVKAFFAVFTLFVCVELLTIPWFSAAKLRTEDPVKTALMQQRLREAESSGKQLSIKQKWIPLSKLPRHLINAVVLAEDGTFWEHGGFDWYEFQQSLKKNWEKKRVVRGASTITQQLAKNIYLSTSKDPIRKLKEWIITLLLEHHLEKQRILEIYLNVIEWGRGIFGVEEAARAYFGRSASALTYEQSLRLAAVIPSPLKHKPTDGSRWVMFRKRVIAQRMMGRKYTETELEPEEDEDDNDAPSQLKETALSKPPSETSPADTGKVSTPQDSTDFMEGNGYDIQRREQAD